MIRFLLGRFFSKSVYILRDKIYLGILGFVGKLYLYMVGVSFCSDIKLFGLPIVSVERGSSISIGRRSRIRSDPSGNAVGINHPVVLRSMSHGACIRIGDDFGMSGGAICAMHSVVIGDRVMVGANVTIVDSDLHPIDSVRRFRGEKVEIVKPVIIEDDVWIGADCFIGKGVTIGKGAVIGARSVVVHSVPSGVIAAGCPARVVKFIS